MHRKKPPKLKHIWLDTNNSTEEYDIMANQNRNKIQEGVLITSDRLRAAALLSFGIRLVNAEPNNSGERLVFVFDDENNAARLASSCFLQDRPVGVQTFCNNLRKVQELIFNWHLTKGRD